MYQIPCKDCDKVYAWESGRQNTNKRQKPELLTRVMRLGLESRLESLDLLYARMTCVLTWTCNKILGTLLGLGSK